MNQIKSLFVMAIVACLALTAAASVTFYVSPAGDDQHDGKSVAQAFATLARARDAVRQLKSSGRLPDGGVTVEILGGKYSLKKTLEFTAADSGTKESPIVYRANQNQPVEILGGRVLKRSEFAPVTDKAMLARLDPAARGKVVCASIAQLGLRHAGPFPPVFDDNGGIFELFWDGNRLPISRWPNSSDPKDWATMEKVVVNGDARHGGTFAYRGDRPERWLHNPDVWLEGQWRVAWEQPAVRVANIDPANHTITFAAGIPLGIGNKYTRPYGNGKEPWCAINLPEEIDQPGEWAIDFSTGTLYLWPPAGQGELMVSQLKRPMIQVNGAAHLNFIGLTLETSLGDGFLLTNAESDLIAGCNLRNLAGRGVVLNGYRSGVQSCDIYQVGEGCIYVSGGDKQRLISSDDFVLNNDLHNYAVLKPMYSAAVNVGFGGENAQGIEPAVGIRVAHNLIYDAPRDAVLVSGENNVFEYNDIFHCGFASSDVGAFYSWRDWTIRGVVIRYNFIHDTVGGVNPDDGASGSLVFGNVFAGPSTGVWIASGPDHTIENNIFVKDQGPVFGMDDRGVARGYATNTVMHREVLAIHPTQPPWSVAFPLMTNLLASHPELPLRTKFERNLVVIQSGGPFAIKMSKARQSDTNLFYAADNWVTSANPGFVDAAKEDYALKPDAEVFKKIPGFKPIPFDRIGLQLDQYRRHLPSAAEIGREREKAKEPVSGDRKFST